MPINKKGGNNAKKNKNSVNRYNNRPTPIPSIEEKTRLMIIKRVSGDCRFLGNYIGNNGIIEKLYITHLPKSSRKYGRVVVESIVLVSVREFQEDLSDIVYLYNANDVEFLKKNGYINASILDTDEDIVSFRNEDVVVKESKRRDEDYNSNLIPDEYFMSSGDYVKKNQNRIDIELPSVSLVSSSSLKNEIIEKELSEKIEDIDFDSI